MPNYCYNRLILRHNDSTKLDEAIAAFKEGTLLNYFVPQPPDLLNQTATSIHTRAPKDSSEPAEIEFPEWYKWRVQHWGTKWDICPDRYKRTKTAVEFSFDTAWAPPLAAYDAVVAAGFEVEADYDEPGVGFGGCYFSKWRFRLSYESEGDDDGQHFPFIAQSGLAEALDRLIGLGDDEEIIASEKIDAVLTHGDFVV
jgi:hypothetical protein